MNNEPPSWIASCVEEFVASSENSLNNGTGEPAWGKPLVGFSSGADPLFKDLKNHVGPFHWSPLEIFSHTFPALPVNPEELTIISWILPQTTATKDDNKKEKQYPSERWIQAKVYGTAFDVKLRNYLETTLVNAGFAATVPRNSPLWEMKISERYGYASTWSERHVAYISGLGTFGLCDGLITPVGKAMQCGSVIARIAVTPTKRPYSHHHEYCLFYAKGTCGRCIERCPVGAITKEGHDKIKCGNHLRPGTEEYVKRQYGIDGYACGLCQTDVPCQSGIPV